MHDNHASGQHARFKLCVLDFWAWGLSPEGSHQCVGLPEAVSHKHMSLDQSFSVQRRHEGPGPNTNGPGTSISS
eukprot:1157334-Pelagomonas_calceolata.AAC.4